ncbi:MAG: Gfo/Idh/MocA family oxidoreductase [Campylobacterales bacterium]
MSSKKFALIGAGYIAPRHMKAIRESGNELVAFCDPKDSVGIVDSYFPDAHFFTELERFDRHIDKRRRKGEKVDYISICSPNYLHDSHIRFALRNGADAICEKPLVLNPWNIDALSEIEAESEKKIYNILQLRLHPSIVSLKHSVDKSKKAQIELTYITSRGRWYDISWKGDLGKSGGVATNIGIHFFDMLIWIYGGIQKSTLHIHTSHTASGLLELENADVKWFLSTDSSHLPSEIAQKGQRTYRSIKDGDSDVEFSDGFTDLHTSSYREILKGSGFGLEESRASIELVYAIRNSKPIGLSGEYHPFCKRVVV